MTTVRARVLLLASSTALVCLGTVAGTAAAAPAPDGPAGVFAPSETPEQQSSAQGAQVAPPPVSEQATTSSVPPNVDPRTHSTKPVYDYANAVRESVYVDTTMDTDSDGTDDVIAVDIVRP